MPMHRFRKDYYQAGRLLMFTGCLSSAGIILGYAVEVSLKTLLIASGFNKRSVLHGHSITDLFNACQKRKLLSAVKVSNDFLQYIEDWLNQRYPSQRDEVSNRLDAQGLAATFGLPYIDCYDDFLLQIDDELVAQSKDAWRISVGVRSAVEAETFNGQAFFHCNTAAYLRSQNYLRVLERHDPNNAICIGALKHFTQRLWISRSIHNHVAALRPSVSLNDHPASLFVYPQKGQPHRAITYSNMARIDPTV